jgi:hypothetical protein
VPATQVPLVGLEPPGVVVWVGVVEVDWIVVLVEITGLVVLVGGVNDVTVVVAVTDDV